MDISAIIAQVLGILFVLVGLSMIFNSKAAASAIEESVQNKGILWLWGFLAVLIGAVVVVLNNAWTSGLPLLITILGWIALVKGVFILSCPKAAVSLYKRFNKSGTLMLCGIIALVFGLILLYW